MTSEHGEQHHGIDVDTVVRHDDDVVVDEDQHDQDVDDELDRLDDGGSVVGDGGEGGGRAAVTSDARSEALPFVLTAREHFASVGDVEITGDARVDAATARLDEIPDLPTSDHVAVYDDVHRRLQDALSDAEVR
jgi:hypothetical protein